MITPEQIKIMAHAMGFNTSRKQYRNKYIACIRNDDLDALCNAGMMERRGLSSKYSSRLYVVTPFGAEFVASQSSEPLEFEGDEEWREYGFVRAPVI